MFNTKMQLINSLKTKGSHLLYVSVKAAGCKLPYIFVSYTGKILEDKIFRKKKNSFLEILLIFKLCGLHLGVNKKLSFP